jgi:hypothetical protein
MWFHFCFCDGSDQVSVHGVNVRLRKGTGIRRRNPTSAWTRDERASLVSCVGEPLKRSVGLLTLVFDRGLCHASV